MPHTTPEEEESVSAFSTAVVFIQYCFTYSRAPSSFPVLSTLPLAAGPVSSSQGCGAAV